VTGQTFALAALWSYGLAAVAYLLLAARMALGLKGSRRGALLLAVVLVTTVWALCGAWFGQTPSRDSLLALNIADTLRYALWFGFIAALLAGATAALPRWVVVFGGLLLIASIFLSETLPLGRTLAADQRPEYAVRVGLAILGLVHVEQLYRRAHPQARWGIKPLAVSLSAMFGFDLFLFAGALLFGVIDADVWIARGVANALVIPFIAIATARNTGWTIEMHLSRGAVFHSTALLVSGLFLLAVAGAGYIVRYFGGDWGRALQIELLFAAVVFGALVATSGRFRSRLKVFVSKHFFSYRYDYREEWLRFTRTLSTDSGALRSGERAIQALADLVESPAGALWLADEREGFRPAARLNMPPVELSLGRDTPLAAFLARTGWIVTLPELAAHPDRYPGLVSPAWLQALPNAWLVIPLSTGAQLVGFIVLLDPRSPVDVDWEVRDLLKAAARAAAAYLQQLTATEALLETRKFDAFNRMSAFVVHDLKNLVAQLSLMQRNAERHRDNPEFQRDMLDTVAHVVSRMNALMLQLRTGTTPVENARPVELAPIVQRVCAAKTAGARTVELALAPGVHALGHEERLEHVIGHLVQNALDATNERGGVRVSVARDNGFAAIEVADTGVGMSAQFQRERLFKPFETTKPAGMGIGVYESQQYVAGLGGRIAVESSEGAGTRVRVLLPQGDGTSAPNQPLEEAA
jgi:putative PEP-CTERM system histidine kinase